MLTKEMTSAQVIATLYVALTREAWMEGPTESEAITAANEWYYATYGYDADEAASVAIPKMFKERKSK